MNSYKTLARWFGVCFILSFVSYALGSGLVEPLIKPGVTAIDVLSNRSQIICGALLIAVFHTLFNLLILIIMFRIFKTKYPYLALTYFSAGAFATFMLAIGAVFLLLPLAIGEEIIKAGGDEPIFFQVIQSIATKGNFLAYQLGMAIWGVGGLLFCYMLYNSKLVSRVFPIWGFLGYAIFISGTFMELLGVSVGLLMSLPGGLYEISLSLWLIVRGFARSLGSSSFRVLS